MPYTVVTAISSGYTGSPGWHRMKFMGALSGAEAVTAINAVKTFYTAVATYIPSIWRMSFVSPAQVYNDSGVLQSEVTISPLPSQLVATGSGSYAGGVGCVVYWNTQGINGGHKVRGRSYLVPLASAAFESDGTIAGSALTAISAAATALVAGTPALAVNSRKLDSPDRGDQTHLVTSATVADRSAVLRTRRG